MPDVFTQAKRSAVMARIRSTGNKDTELRLIALMRAAGIRGWRRGVRLKLRETDSEFSPRRTRRARSPGRLSGKKSSVSSVVPLRSILIRPDFIFRRERLAVFVDGCYWHGCPQHATWPRNNAAFWRAKIEGNRARDRRQDRLLRAHGWRVLRLWEHALAPRLALRSIARLQRALASRMTLRRRN